MRVRCTDIITAIEVLLSINSFNLSVFEPHHDLKLSGAPEWNVILVSKWNLSFSWIAASWLRLLLTGKVDFVQTNAWWTLTAALTANAKWSRTFRIRSVSASANLVGSATNAKKVYAVSAHPMLQYRGCAWWVAFVQFVLGISPHCASRPQRVISLALLVPDLWET